MGRSPPAFAASIRSRWDCVCGGVAGKRPACDADMLKQQQPLDKHVIFLYSDDLVADFCLDRSIRFLHAILLDNPGCGYHRRRER
jgi:hypothetical protein